MAPPGRCQDSECVIKDQYAVQRVLEVVGGEEGKFYLLLEYLGYRYLEARLDSESRLVDRNSDLKRAENMQCDHTIPSQHALLRRSHPRCHVAWSIFEGTRSGSQIGASRRSITSASSATLALRCTSVDSPQVWHRRFKCSLHRNIG